jgi:hypothetical protein
VPPTPTSTSAPRRPRSSSGACFAVGAASGTISAEESAVLNQIGKELQLDPDIVNDVRAEFHERLSSVQTVRRLAEGR